VEDALEALLATKGAEGRYFDTASFTIDSVKALQKLSAYQLPHSGLWLVKLVQAAVAGGAPSVEVKFGRKLVEVAFTPKTAWQADEVLETVVSGTLPSDTALMHLITAIRASSASVTEAVTWSCGEARVELSAKSCLVSSQEACQEFRLTAVRPSRSRSLAHTLASPVSQLVKQTVEEHDALRERCWVSPIPITVDGRQLETGYEMVEGGYIEHSPLRVLRAWERSEQYVLTVCLGIRPLGSPEFGPEIPYLVRGRSDDRPSQGLIVTTPTFKKESFLRWDCPTQTCNGTVSLLSGPHIDQARLIFVCDGAMVDNHPLDPWRLDPKAFLGISLMARPRIGVRAILGVTPQQLDLSQFAVREPNIEAAMARMAPCLSELVEKLRQHLSDFYYLPFPRRQAGWVGFGLGTQMVIAAAISQGVLALPLAGLLAVVSIINTAGWRGQVKKALGQLLRQLQP
jgi:hypothetical protein